MSAILAIALATQPVAPPAAVAPRTAWLVDGEEDLCILQREYGADKDHQLTLAFKPLLDLDTMELYVVTTDRSMAQHSGDASVTLSGDRKFAGTYFSIAVTSKNLRYTRLSVDRAILSQMKDGDVLTVNAKPIAAAFRIVRPEKAVPVLQECIESLEKSWGIDPASKAAVATQPQGNPAGYFTADSYPREAYANGIYGRVVALLNVGVAGQVENCRIVSSAGKALNEGTCKAAMHIRFRPARGKDGKPVASTYLLPVRWVLP